MVSSAIRKKVLHLPGKVRRYVDDVITVELPKNPLLGKKLKANLEDRRSIRKGDYRIVYVVDKAKSTITIKDIGHRRCIYKPHSFVFLIN